MNNSTLGKSRRTYRPRERDVVFVGFQGNGTAFCGDHPAVVLKRAGDNVLVIPVTENKKKHPHHVPLEPNGNGLWKASAAKCESIQCVPNIDIRRFAGRCSQEDMARIVQGVKSFMNLDAYLEKNRQAN